MKLFPARGALSGMSSHGFLCRIGAPQEGMEKLLEQAWFAFTSFMPLWLAESLTACFAIPSSDYELSLINLIAMKLLQHMLAHAT